jgi:hypothetical protein
MLSFLLPLQVIHSAVGLEDGYPHGRLHGLIKGCALRATFVSSQGWPCYRIQALDAGPLMPSRYILPPLYHTFYIRSVVGD